MNNTFFPSQAPKGISPLNFQMNQTSITPKAEQSSFRNTFGAFPVIMENRLVNNNNVRFNSKPHYVIDPPRRFLPDYTPLSGVNVKEVQKSFMLKDIISPLSKTSLLYNTQKPDYECRKDKYALNPSLSCPKQNTVPKFQQYKEYYFPKRDKVKTEEYSKSYLSTDNVAIKFPSKEVIQKNANLKNSFIEMKKGFYANTESETSFVPKSYLKSINNRSSVNYNIITFKGKDGSSDNTAGVLEKKLNNRKKGVGEYADLTKTFAVNPGVKYLNAYNNQNKRFYHYNGIFTHLYDSSIRNGKIIMPFTKDKQNIKKTLNKNNF